jgi:hypothetical protein
MGSLSFPVASIRWKWKQIKRYIQRYICVSMLKCWMCRRLLKLLLWCVRTNYYWELHLYSMWLYCGTLYFCLDHMNLVKILICCRCMQSKLISAGTYVLPPFQIIVCVTFLSQIDHSIYSKKYAEYYCFAVALFITKLKNDLNLMFF